MNSTVMGSWLNLLTIIVLIVSLVLACNLYVDVGARLQLYFGSKVNVDMVIGVLSSRHHFAQRQALRDTWVGHIKDSSDLKLKILVKFLVGKQACDIPTEYKDDPYNCRELNISYDEQGMREELDVYQVTHCAVDENPRANGAIGFDFKVNHAIIVDKLGVFDNEGGNSTHSPKKVLLYDAWRQEPIVISHFSLERPGTLKNGFRFRPVEPYILPKNFEGTLVVEGLETEDVSGTCTMASNKHGLITLKQFNRFGDAAGSFPTDTVRLLPSSPHHVSGNFIYHIHDPEGLSSWRKNRLKVTMEHIKNTSKETRKLEKELSTHNDIILLDVVDTYRNIPKKLLQFYKWVDVSTNFQFVIKTDDDCYLNIHNIIKGIKDKELQKVKRTWWGHFRTNWALDHDGKWAELEYPCSEYPSFACGAGSLLTSDVVRWISLNTRYLYSYQGEDTSMGIWLSSIMPIYDHDPNWICDDICHLTMYVSAEHSPDKLRTMWKNLKLCDNPCGCLNAWAES